MTTRDQEIIKLYTTHLNLSANDIATQMNISVGTVYRVLKLNKIPTRKKYSMNQETELAIIKEYQQGISIIKLEKKYHTSYEKIITLLDKYNIPQKSKASLINPNFIEHYFYEINSYDKAYWLGWLISDGCITENTKNNRYRIELTISDKDEEILTLFEADLGLKNKISTFQTNYKRFGVGSKIMVQDLKKLNVTANKTFTVSISDKIDKKYYPALIRGLFDGDGGFTTYTRTSGQYCCELSFCGNEQIVTWIRNTLLEALPELSPNKVTKESSIKRVRWSSKKDIRLIRDYIYYNHNNHYLKRKYNLIYANTEVTE